MCLFMCVAEARHNPCSLGNKPFETRYPGSCMFNVEYDYTVVIRPLFRMPTNQKQLNRIGKIFYNFTPRKIVYLKVLVNLIYLGHMGCPGVFLPPCIYRPIQTYIFFFSVYRSRGGRCWQYS